MLVRSRRSRKMILSSHALMVVGRMLCNLVHTHQQMSARVMQPTDDESVKCYAIVGRRGDEIGWMTHAYTVAQYGACLTP